MDTIDRILLPVDFSRMSGRALRHATALAGRLGAELHVLHVDVQQHPGGVGASAADEAMESFVSGGGEACRRRGAAAPAGPGWEAAAIRRVIRTGDDVVRTVLAYARDEQIDLILMGIHGFRDTDTGSFYEERTAGQVVRLAPCPVLTIGLRGLHRPYGLRRILVPVDFSGASALALRQARILAARTRACLVLMHVLAPASGCDDANEEAAFDRWCEVERAYAELDAFYERAGGPAGIRLFVVRRGDPAHHVTNFACRWEVDLIVHGAHESTTDEAEMPLGDLAAAVVPGAPCPVLITRPKRDTAGARAGSFSHRVRRAPSSALHVHA